MADKAEGKGRMTYTNGCVYEGSWRNGCRDGKGKFYDPAGNCFDGEFLNDKKHGNGVMTFKGICQISLRFNNGKVSEATGFKFEEGTAWADPDY